MYFGTRSGVGKSLPVVSGGDQLLYDPGVPMFKKFNGWMRIWIVFTVIWSFLGVILVVRAFSSITSTNDGLAGSRAIRQKIESEINGFNPKIDPMDLLLGLSTGVAKGQPNSEADSYILREYDLAWSVLPKASKSKIIEFSRMTGLPKEYFLDEPASVTHYKTLFAQVKQAGQEVAAYSIALEGEKVSLARLIGATLMMPLALLGLGKTLVLLVKWIRDGFRPTQNTEATAQPVPPVRQEIQTLEPHPSTSPAPGNAIEDPRPLASTPTTAAPPMDAGVWPKWDWADWIGAILVGYVAELGTKILLAIAFGKNSQIPTPLDSIAFHLPAFLIYYLIKRAYIRSHRLQGFSHSQAGQWLLSYFGFCIFLAGLNVLKQ